MRPTEYGRVDVARSATSQSDDLFGPVMNMCSKINSKALPNGIAIGDGLYKVIQSMWLCRNHAFDRFSQSFLEVLNTIDIEGI
ncbi:MAG: hypothetical protein WA323_10850 [Candidatus Nitrosopolaris sp.]